jgi:hypothetical protein
MAMLGNIAWGATALLALERGASSGIVVTALIVGTSHDASVPSAPALWIMWTVLGSVCAAGAHLVWRGVGAVFGSLAFAANLGMLITSLAIAVGDPLIWTLSKLFPAVVPVREFKFINFEPLILVIKAGEAA